MEIEELKLERYAEYKDSGVEWLGEVPTHWKIEKLKNIVDFINRGATPEYVDCSNYKVINQATFSKGFFDFDNAKSTSEKSILTPNLERSRVIKNDILLASTGGGVLGKVFYIGFDINNYFADSHVTIVRGSKNQCITKFYYYILLINYDLINGILAQGSTNQTELQRSWLSSLNLPLPSLEEQATIVHFLDDKTARIDQAINIKQKQISLLKERKQILIHKAVTQGIDSNVILKDSGIGWIGEIPEHWEVKRLRFLGKTQNGISKGAEYFGTGFPFVSYGDVYRDIELPILVSGLAESSVEDRKQYSVIQGDILFTRTSETVEEIGYSSTCLQTIKDATFAGFLIRFRPRKNILDKEFSKYYFSSKTHRAFFVKEMNLVIRASLSQDLLKKMPVLLPPLSEQAEIGRYLNDVNCKVETAIGLKEKEIEKLKEYKVSLINSVVTGNVKVF